LAGEIKGGLVENCAVSGTILAGELQNAGLLAGYVSGRSAVSILRCGVAGAVTAACAGGLVGMIQAQSQTQGDKVRLEACHGSVRVKAIGDDAQAGGLVGHLEATMNNATLTDCYATGDVTAQSTGQSISRSLAGGLVGLQASQGGLAALYTSYATGAVKAIGYQACAGGLTGCAEDESPVTWQDCAALNASLEADFLTGAVVAMTSGNGNTDVQGCFRWDGLEDWEQLTTDFSAENLALAATWGSFSSSSWQTPTDGSLPILARAAGRQSGDLPLHLTDLTDTVVISTAERLAELAAKINGGSTGNSQSYAEGNYRLGADLDLSDLDWVPIGDANTPFSGEFDGAGHRITGLTVDGYAAAGLFGVLDSAVVENLLLPGCQVDGTGSAGAVAGVAIDSAIRNCAASGQIDATGQAGGLVGKGKNTAWDRLSFTGDVNGGTAAGGLIGDGEGELTDSHSAGTVTGGISGGLAGIWEGDMDRCYTTVSKGSSALVFGGLVGQLESSQLQNLVYLGKQVAPMAEEIADSASVSLERIRLWDGREPSSQEAGPLAEGIGDLPAGAAFFAAADFWQEGFWQTFETAAWSALAEELPLLAYDLADGEAPSYLRGDPAEDAALVLLCQEGDSLPSSALSRTLALEAVIDDAWQPVPLVGWSLAEREENGPALTTLAGNRASLTIPGNWVGSVTILAVLDRWPDVSGSFTLHINGDLGQSGAAVNLDREAARYGDRLTAAFTQPDGAIPARNVTLEWLVNDIAVGSGSTLDLSRADWIGYSVKVRARAANFASPVESPALLIGKKLYGGEVADPREQARTGDSLTLNSLAGYEYACVETGGSLSPDDWGRETYFPGLTPGISYSFYQRVAETADTEASLPSQPLLIALEKAAENGEDNEDDEDDEENNEGQEEEPPDKSGQEEGPPPEDSLPAENALSPAENPGQTILDPVYTDSSDETSNSENQSSSSPDTTQPISIDLTHSRGISLARTAAQSARRKGATTALITLNNPGRIRLETMKSMTAAAGMPLLIYADNLSEGRQVAVRISLNPARATKDLNLSAVVSYAQGSSSGKRTASKGGTALNRAQTVRELFWRAYGSDTAVISYGQREDFGMPVEIAALLEVPGGDPLLLPYWSYQRSTGIYRRMKEVAPWRDSRGYIHFQTDRAGDLVVGGPFRAR
jgi:hypothetical protein